MVLYSLNIVFSCGWVYPSTLLLALPLFVLRLVPLLRLPLPVPVVVLYRFCSASWPLR